MSRIFHEVELRLAALCTPDCVGSSAGSCEQPHSDMRQTVSASALMPRGPLARGMTSAYSVIARSALPKAVRDAAIGPLCPSRGSVFERSRLAFPETRWAAVTDCHVATYGRSSQ